jgi:hypothetical protein
VRSGVWRGTTYRAPDHSAQRPVTASVARNAFCLGFVQRLGQRLREAQDEAHRAALATDPSQTVPGTAGAAGSGRVDLALRARDVAVTDYHRAATRARGTWRGSSSAAGSAATSRRAGERAADEYGRRSVSGGRRQIET